MRALPWHWARLLTFFLAVALAAQGHFALLIIAIIAFAVAGRSRAR